MFLYCCSFNIIRGGTDKSLARPGRKTNQLGVYSTYSPRSSIHFLARCSNFCKPLREIRMVFHPTRSPRQQWPPRWTKNGELSIVFFQSREQAVVRRDQMRIIGWDIETLEAQISQFLLGCKWPVSWDTVVQEQDHLGEIPTVFFLQNVHHLHQHRCVILRVDSLAFWKIINEEEAVLIPKNRCENFSSGFLHSDFFLRRGEPLCRHSIDCCFVSGSYWYNQILFMVINRDRKPSGSRRKKFQELLRRLAPLTFLIPVQAFRETLRGELPHVKTFKNDGRNPLTWDAQLISYWFSQNPAVFQD